MPDAGPPCGSARGQADARDSSDSSHNHPTSNLPAPGVTAHRLPHSGCLVPLAWFRLPGSACLVPPASFRLPRSGWRLSALGWPVPDGACRLSAGPFRMAPVACRLARSGWRLSAVGWPVPEGARRLSAGSFWLARFSWRTAAERSASARCSCGCRGSCCSPLSALPLVIRRGCPSHVAGAA
jgi:hypothetical protein